MVPTQYVAYCPNILNSSKKNEHKKLGDVVNLERLGCTEGEKITRDFNHLAYNKIFCLTTKLFKHTLIKTDTFFLTL